MGRRTYRVLVVSAVLALTIVLAGPRRRSAGLPALRSAHPDVRARRTYDIYKRASHIDGRGYRCLLGACQWYQAKRYQEPVVRWDCIPLAGSSHLHRDISQGHARPSALQGPRTRRLLLVDLNLYYNMPSAEEPIWTDSTSS